MRCKEDEIKGNGRSSPLVSQRQIRYLTPEELTRLRQHAEARALQAREKDTVGPVRAWALLDTLLSSGLRASEAAALRVGDCLPGYGQASLLVRQGKGDGQRLGEGLPGCATEGANWCEMAAAGPRKCRKRVTDCCESVSRSRAPWRSAALLAVRINIGLSMLIEQANVF